MLGYKYHILRLAILALVQSLESLGDSTLRRFRNGQVMQLRFICFLCSLLFIDSQLLGQDIRISPSIGFENGRLLTIHRNPGVINRFSSDGIGNSYNNSFWLGTDINFKYALIDIDMIVRLRLGTSIGAFTSLPYYESSQPVTTLNEFKVTSRQSLSQCDILLKHNFWENIALALGPWCSFRLSSDIIETEHILEPLGATFHSSNSRERTVDAGQVLESFPFRVGFVAGILYNIPLTSTLSVSPTLASRCDFEALCNGLGARSFSIDAGIAFNIGSINAITTSPTLSVDTLAIIAGQSHIEATVDLLQFDTVNAASNHAIIYPQTTYCSNYVTFTPLILFTADSTDFLHTADTQVVDGPRKHPDFSLANGRILRTIASRLLETPKAQVTLCAVTLPGEPSINALQRAQAISHSLQNHYGIPSSRIMIENCEDTCGIALTKGSPYVRILTSPPAILAPLTSQRIVNDFVVPRIMVDKTISSALGVKTWALTIQQGERTIAHLSKQKRASDEFNTIIPANEILFNLRPSPLVAELKVEDHSGAVAYARDELYFQIGDPGAISDREVRTYTLINPFIGCINSSLSNDVLIADIVDAIHDDAQITITPIDRTNGLIGAMKIGEQILSALNYRLISPYGIKITTAPSWRYDDGRTYHSLLQLHGINVTIEQKFQH